MIECVECHGVSWSVMDSHRMSCRAMDCHRVSWDVMKYLGESWSVIRYFESTNEQQYFKISLYGYSNTRPLFEDKVKNRDVRQNVGWCLLAVMA